MKNNHLIPANYNDFRKTLSNLGSTRIKSKGTTTVLMDARNQVIAMMRAGKIDDNGRCHPARYYVARNQCVHTLVAA